METVAIDWTYTISTLAVRFVGVFVVLGILQVVMQISGRIFATMDAEDGQKAISKPAEASHAVTAEQAAAIGMALYLYEKRIFTTMDAGDRQKAISKPAEASHAVTAEQAAAVGMALYLSAESQGSGGHGQ